MSYDQEYNEQPIYELDFQYSEDSESDTTKPLPKLSLTRAKLVTESSHRALSNGRGRGIHFPKGSGPVARTIPPT